MDETCGNAAVIGIISGFIITYIMWAVLSNVVGFLGCTGFSSAFI